MKTLDEVFAVYTQEPFDLRPWEIARLTDWQLEFLYRRPAVRAARLAKGMSPDDPSWNRETAAPEAGDSMPRDREKFVQWWLRNAGGDRASALKRHAEEFGDG